MKLTKDSLYRSTIDLPVQKKDKWVLTTTYEFDTEEEAMVYLETLKQDLALDEFINKNFTIEEFDAKVRELLREVGHEIDGVEVLM